MYRIWSAALIACWVISFTVFSHALELKEDGKHLFILSGQSNMRNPLPSSFKEAVEQVFGEDKVIVVTVAHPSQPIKRWYKNWKAPDGYEGKEGEVFGEIYDRLLAAVKKQIEGKDLASVTYIWMQGEADAGSGWGEMYEESFYGVLDQFKKDLEIDKINYVLGRINDYWLPQKGIKHGDIVRAVQEKIGESHDNGDWVNTDDLNTGLNPWGLYEQDGGHFPPMGYEVLGQRFARKACRVIDPDIKLDEGIFDAVFYHEATDIKTHDAIGKKISGTQPYAMQALGGLEALVDGKYGNRLESDETWIGFSPDEESVELVVDLGESMKITGVGFNMLIDEVYKTNTPDKITISTSTDGKEFKPAHGKGINFFYKKQKKDAWLHGLGTKPVLVNLSPNKAEGRYVKISFEKQKEKTWLLLDEIIVNPVSK